jgi:diamine N-acetyltransferase
VCEGEDVAADRGPSAPTRLVPVTDANVGAVLKLKVKVEQTSLVASTAKSMRQSTEKASLVPRAFYEGEKLVGFAMWDRLPDGSAYIWRVMIGADDQHRGLGRKLMAAVVDEIRASGAPKVRISHRPENRVAAHLFEQFGFDEVDFEPDGEVIRDLVLMPKDRVY